MKKGFFLIFLMLQFLASQAQTADKKKVDKDRGFDGVKLGMQREDIPYIRCGFHDYTNTFWWCTNTTSRFSLGSINSHHTEFGFFGKKLHKIIATIYQSELDTLVEELTKLYGKPEYKVLNSESDQYYYEWRGKKTNLLVTNFGKQHPISVSFNMNNLEEAHKKIMKKMHNDPEIKEAYEEELDRKSLIYKSKRAKN